MGSARHRYNASYTAAMSSPSRRLRWRKLLRWLGILAMAWLGSTWLAVLILRFVPPLTSAVMVERQVGAWLHGDMSFRLRQHWVPWKRVSPWVPLAMVAGEDQKFPYHHGFDFDSINKAIDAADDGKRLRGASTISQQTAKNLFLWNGRSFVRKGLEAYFTVLIELTWPKRRILEVYMNIAELGNGIYGAEAAARQFFGKSASQLGARESALLASVLPNPKKLRADRPSPYVARHAEWVERQVRQLGGANYLPR